MLKRYSLQLSFIILLGVLTIIMQSTNPLTRLSAEDETDHLTLSGPVKIIETEHFRIQYTLEGADATTEAYVKGVIDALEAAWERQIDDMGWPAPPTAGDLYPVYIASLKDREGPLMGYVENIELVGDNPNTDRIEAWAATSYLVIENDFAEIMEDDDDPYDLMRTTVAHELHHAIQMGYDASEIHEWYYEATATWMEIATFDLGSSAIEYVIDNFTYPEVCFGTAASEEDDILLDYGNWLFLQSLSDRHGDEIVQALWEAIADDEGFVPLELTLKAYGETLPEAMIRHHIQTLTRSYPAIEETQASVWLTAAIRDVGNWWPEGLGVQELGANFFHLKRPPGDYDVFLADDNGHLTLWAAGIRNDEVNVISLGRGGTVTTTGYDYLYLIVFNPVYDDDILDCHYIEYSLDVSEGTGQPPALAFTMNASDFLPLEIR